MPRKRSGYIDKKKSTSYALLAGDGDHGSRVLHPIKRGGRWIDGDEALDHFPQEDGPRDDHDDFDRWIQASIHPSERQRAREEAARAARAGARALLGGDGDAPGEYGEEFEAKRREILALGLPDDGYDYTQHLRTMTVFAGDESSSEEEEEGKLVLGERRKREEGQDRRDGAVVFVEAPAAPSRVDDRALFNARHLRVDRGARDDDEAEERVDAVSAFARPVDEFKGFAARELVELEEAMAQAEDDEGDASFFDELVVQASAPPPQGSSEEGEEVGSESGASYSDKSEDEEDDEEEGAEANGRRLPFQAQSVASTAWMKPARTDRNEALDLVDERFEAMVIKEYSEEQYGDLESDEDERDRARGPGQVSSLAPALDDFLAQHVGPSARQPKEKLISAAEWFAQQEEIERGRRAKGRGVDGDSDDAEGDGEDEGDEGLGLAGPVAEGLPGGSSPEASEAGVEWLKEAHRRMQENREREDAAAAHAKTKELAERMQGEDVQLDAEEDWEHAVGKGYLRPTVRSKWDCETVLSLRSNLDNHPGTIDTGPRGKITLSAKTGLPVGFVGARPLAEVAEGSEGSGEEGSEGGSGGSEGDVPVNAGQARPRGETAEERRERKREVKEARREARMRKKEVKQAFVGAEKEVQRRQARGGHGVSAMRL